MANKTIYVKDDELWDRAKGFAGKEGLSAVIQQALAQYVRVKRAESEGYKQYRLEVGFQAEAPVGDDHERFGTTERIAFEGQQLVSHEMMVPARQASDPDEWEAIFTVYRTRGGRLILTVDDTGGHGYSHYGIYGSLKELSADSYLNDVSSRIDRAEFLDAVAKKLGQDWAVWIE